MGDVWHAAVLNELDRGSAAPALKIKRTSGHSTDFAGEVFETPHPMG